MINIKIDGDNVFIDTEDKKKNTTGATKEELQQLKRITNEYCKGDCKEGSE